jgi:hypothetical protein
MNLVFGYTLDMENGKRRRKKATEVQHSRKYNTIHKIS